MIDPAALRRPAVRVDRSSDRRVALVAMVISVGYMAAALAATLLPDAIRQGVWLPIHLALAGGATTAIAGVMPFFSAAIASAPPSDARLRLSAVAAVALGAAGVAFGVVTSAVTLAAVFGVLFIVGLGATLAATLKPLTSGLGPRGGLVTRGYTLAVLEVAVGATLATLYLFRWPPIVEVWPQARMAHAWLNVIGFVSLVIGTTLLHFFPTVVGARIASHRSAWVAVGGLAIGPPLVAAGALLSSDILARFGALVVLAGAGGLTFYASLIWRTRAHWTTDPSWHAFAMGGLVCAIGWLDLGLLVAAGRVIIAGADPHAWSTALVVGPLVAGWIGLALVASVTHLIPAVGPGDHAAHARQRRLLGRAALVRLATINLGVAAITAGLWLSLPLLTALGLALAGVGFGATAALIFLAVLSGRAEKAS